MKNDPAHIATDEEIAKIEKLINKEYKKAHKEVSKKCDDYFAAFVTKDEKWQEWVANGTKTEKEYKQWRTGQMLVGQKWEDLRDSIATDYTNAAKITQSITKDFAPGVYALNHNYATFEIEKGSLLDTSYTLYSRETVEHMYKGKPKLYHSYGKAVAKEIKEGKQYAWDRRRITSVLTQAVVQGESIPKITKRLEQVTVGDHNAAIRNARTMMTGVQNAGRIDAFERAKELGIPVKKQWLSTLDSRTRHWHRDLDGEAVDVEEPFENKFGEIMFPGDPDAEPANVYNCRCTMMAAIDNFEIDVTDPSVRPQDSLEDMTYDEWLAEKKSVSKPITSQEDKGNAIQGAWNKQYGGKGNIIENPAHKHTAAEGKALMDKYANEEMNKSYSNIWANKTVTPADYPNMKKQVTDKKWQIDKQIEKAKAKGDATALAKYQAQKDAILDFEKQGQKYLKANPVEVKKTASKAKAAPKVKQTAKAEKTAEKANKGPQKASAAAQTPKPKEYSNIWANKTVKPEDYPGMKKQVNDKKWNLNKQIAKAEAKGDLTAAAKYKAQLDDLLDFEKEGQKFLTAGGKTAPKAAPKPKEPKAPKAKKVTEKQAAKNLEDAVKKVNDLVETEYANIWAEPVTVEKYAEKKGSIAAKKQYFQDKLAEATANGWQSKVDKFTALLDDLAEFEAKGKAYEAAKAEYEAAKKAYEPFVQAKTAKFQAQVDALKADAASLGGDLYDLGGAHWSLPYNAKVEEYPNLKKKITSAKKSLKEDISLYEKWGGTWADKVAGAKENLKKVEAYEEAGKKYAKLLKDKEKAESKIAALTKGPSVNKGGGAYSQARKDKALWARTRAEYNRNDTIFDRHARKVHATKTAAEHEGYYHYTWGSGPFNQMLAGFKNGWGGTFVGPNKLDINYNGYGNRIRGLTRLCEKSKQEVDFWVQSGQTLETLEGMLKLPYGTLQNMNDAALQQFVGAQKELPQFISGAINKGGGSYTPGNMLFNVYCPKGSEALYVLEDGMYGKGEHEMILQRGGTYRITKIYWGRDEVHGGRKLIVDMELRLEEGYHKFQQ